MFRSSGLTTRRRSRSGQRDSHPEMQYFKEITTKTGICIQYADGPNVFSKEQSLIIRDFQKEIENHASYPENIQDFMVGLKKLATKPQYFKKVLLPSELQQINESDSIIGMKQESVMRVFLSVNSIQSEIIEFILKEVGVHAVNDENDTTWIRLLLGPLRYLSYITDIKTLTTKLLEILDVAVYSVQLEILNYIPEIIPDCEFDDVAKHLIKLLDENSELMGAIVDCFNYLNLSADVKSQVQDYILGRMQSTNSPKLIPMMFQFLVSDCKPNNLDNVLIKTRSALDSIMTIQSDSNDNESDQVLTFEAIKLLAISSKVVADGWVTIISNVRLHNDHKPVDFLILLMLHSVGGNRKHTIETLIKRKIKTRVMRNSLIETALTKYLVPEILKDYLTSILTIASCLLQTFSEPLYVECAKTIYCTTFVNAHADKQQRHQILNDLVFLTGTVPALTIINAIYEDHFDILIPHTTQLMNLLYKIEDLSFVEVKKVFCILGGLVCGPYANNSTNMLQNELHIVVRKQLSSSKRNIKYRGIIAAVALAANIATIIEQQSESSIGEESMNSVSLLPLGDAKQAATLLTLTNTTTLNCPIAKGLYYDQLSQMIISSDSLDKYFMAWIFDTITNDFQSIYITENEPNDLNDIPLSVQHNLNKTDEVDEPIYINISEMVIRQADDDSLILTMASQFRLLRLVHFKQSGSLQTIDALLGCGVVMPVIDVDIGVENFGTVQCEQIANCVFHCINWFRELINAFVAQKGANLQLKLLTRLEQLVQLEELLCVCMKSVPNHQLPQSYFYNVGSSLDKTKVTKPPRKKTKKSDPNETKLTQSQATKATRKNTKDKDVIVSFRELDTDVVMLLKYPMHVSETENLAITLPQYKFIMSDLVNKYKILLDTNKSKDSLMNLNLVKLKDLVADTIRLMPNINSHLSHIIDNIKQLLAQTDNIHDSNDMFQPPALNLKISFELTLEMLSQVFSWSGFQNSKNFPMLRDCLRSLGEAQSTQLKSAQKLINEFLERFGIFMDCCLTLQSAVNLVNILKSLSTLTSDNNPKKKLTEISGMLLSMKWFNANGLPESGAAANASLDILIKAHLSEIKLSALSSIISWVQSEVSNLTGKDDALTTFPSITKANFPILYRGMCTSLVDTTRNSLAGLTNTQHLELWCNVATVMRTLMEIVKIQETRTNLATYLKKMLGVLKLFLSAGIPILEITLKHKSDKVFEILKLIQTSTRFIQNLCCHSKVSKDMGLIAYVPHMRLTLETLIYRVKALLVANKCATAFWMGNLKNKNLKGEEILTQTDDVSVGEHESDDELPSDDSDTEINNSKDGENSNMDGSNSESF